MTAGVLRRPAAFGSAAWSSSGTRPKSTSPWLSDFSGLPSNSCGIIVQKASIGSVSSSTSMPRARAASSLGFDFSRSDALADEIVDLGLVGLQVGHVLLERAQAALARRRGEARERQQLVAALVVLVEALLQHRAEGVPDLAIGLGVLVRRALQLADARGR